MTTVRKSVSGVGDKAASAGDNSKSKDVVMPTSKGQNGLLVPAVKQGAAAGKQATEAGKAEAAAAAGK